MDNKLLDALRFRCEGTDLDFKQAQYRFVGGAEEDKGELLKDILALANAWRDGIGYIVLGFKDCAPHPAEVVGIASHIDDAQLQQFVNSKVKPKLTFRYEELLYEGKTIGLIAIPKQKRPFFLAHPYGKLKSNVVYVRRGSSTDEAEPTESGAMMAADSGRGDLRVDLSVLTPDNEELPDSIARQFLQLPESLPDYEKKRSLGGPFNIDIDLNPMWRDNRHYWRDAAEYVRVESARIEMQFVLNNRSVVELSNAKLEVTVEPLDGQHYEMCTGTDLPEAPKSQYSTLNRVQNIANLVEHRESRVVVDDGGKVPVCHVRFGSLLPGEEGRSPDTLAVLPHGPGKLRLCFRILAGELPFPLESERVIEATGVVTPLDLEGLKVFLGERAKRARADA